MELTAEAVNKIFMDCLFRDEELVDGKLPDEAAKTAIIVEGIVTNAGLHPGRLAEHREEIVALIDELPDTFREGWSFLNLRLRAGTGCSRVWCYLVDRDLSRRHAVCRRMYNSERDCVACAAGAFQLYFSRWRR